MTKENKAVKISVRITKRDRERLERASILTGLPESLLVSSCIEAALDYIDKHGEIRLPLAVIPKKQATSQPTEPIRKTA